jgi:hypothetical protein
MWGLVSRIKCSKNCTNVRRWGHTFALEAGWFTQPYFCNRGSFGLESQAFARGSFCHRDSGRSACLLGVELGSRSVHALLGVSRPALGLALGSFLGISVLGTPLLISSTVAPEPLLEHWWSSRGSLVIEFMWGMHERPPRG